MAYLESFNSKKVGNEMTITDSITEELNSTEYINLKFNDFCVDDRKKASIEFTYYEHKFKFMNFHELANDLLLLKQYQEKEAKNK